MSFSRVLGAAFVAVLPAVGVAAEFDELFPGHAMTEYPEDNVLLRSFNYRQGEVKLPGGQVTLNVPDGYYFLDYRDAEAVLTQLWGNPFGETLGMIFPADYAPTDVESWGAEFQWEGIGYVSDEDAGTYDYDELLVTMQRDTRAESDARQDSGYESVELLGWAEPPGYDSYERKLHWAMELKFGDMETNTLNYELRALGREGVLNVNFIGSISQLDQIKSALPDVSDMVAFNEGKTYADFDPSIDKVAALGIGGLIAGKVAAKAGLLAVTLVMLKKFGVLLLLPLLWVKKLFSGRRSS